MNQHADVKHYQDTVRIDRNIYLNLSDLDATYQEDSILVRDIMIYLAHQFKTDLFGYTTFSLSDFCKVMKYYKSNLQSKHPRSLLKGERVLIIDGRRYDNIFEHTLFLMASRNIILTYTAGTRSKLIDGANAVQVLSDIKIHSDVKKPDRRLYEIKLGSGFVESLMNFYVNISLKNYLNIAQNKGKGKVGNLYIFLCGAKNVLIHNKSNEYTPNFEMLCRIANITAQQPKHRKATLHRYLTMISENTDLRYQVNFCQGRGQSKAYSIKLVFDKEYLDYSEAAISKHFFDTLLEKLELRFKHRFPTYASMPTHNEYFQKWLTNREFDVQLKKQVIMETKKASYNYSSDKTYDGFMRQLEYTYMNNLESPEIEVLF